ncbi:phosphoenolpyruvate phosphomutase [Lachnospiraceae bacterium YSD2013]|nr:phosphoenolpyruvate phosphomutase [Lachnospiraceae bacterium YSD2013]
MKALILNSGKGTRMGGLTANQPKCLTEVSAGETIISRQLNQLADAGIKEVVITTGPFEEDLISYCNSLDIGLDISYVNNEKYDCTNYIYSIYNARNMLEDDIILMHGDLVFENEVIDSILAAENSVMVVSGTRKLPEKDFKAAIKDGHINKIGIDVWDNAVAAQPLYKIKKADWMVWLRRITEFCNQGDVNCYAENAFNEVSDSCCIFPLDVGDLLCDEIDTTEDLKSVSEKLRKVKNRTVYMCFSSDILHSGHMAILKKAMRLGRLTVGVLSDEAIASFKRFPLIPFEQRCSLFSNIKGVHKVVEQKSLSYKEVLTDIKPDVVVHGDNWRYDFQKPIRDEAVEVLGLYGGRLVEFPYTSSPQLDEIERQSRRELSLPDCRRGRLRKLLDMKGLVTVMEAHDGLTGLIVENTVVNENGKTYQFDAMWVSSLCDSTAKGKPDIELVDMTSRFRTIEDIAEVTTKPIIFDGDTGGLAEHFCYTVRSLERLGVSAVIIEDKKGLKKNSLFGTEVQQVQDEISSFCEKIRMGKRAQKTKEFMIIARIESLILERGLDDALERAKAYVNAGADGIMIHSRKKEPDEVFAFLKCFREYDKTTPIVLVPTSFNSVTEDEFKRRGANIIIYANQLMRAAVPAIKDTAESILRNHRSMEIDTKLMPFKEIIRLIPEEF